MSTTTSPPAAIVGVGTSRIGRVPGVSAIELQREAAVAALNDAGMTFENIDGLLTTPIRVANWAMPCGVVAQGLGIRPRYLATLDLAGASGTAMVHHAAMAIASGQCRTVLCVAGQNSPLTCLKRDRRTANIRWWLVTSAVRDSVWNTSTHTLCSCSSAAYARNTEQPLNNLPKWR